MTAAAPLPPRRRPLFAALILALVGLALYAALALATGAGKNMVAGLISRALSTPERKVSIEAVGGLLSSEMTIRGIAIADREGVWLRVPRVLVLWRPWALLALRLEIRAIDIDETDLVRKPVGETAAAAKPGASVSRWPELPLPVSVERFSLAKLEVGRSVIPGGASFSASGSARLGPPSAGFDLAFDARRLDRPATLVLRSTYVASSRALEVRLDLDEAAGGIIAEIADLPGRPAVRLGVAGTGTLDEFRAKLDFDAGAEIGSTGDITLRRTETVRTIGLDLAASVSALLPPALAPIFAGATKLAGTIDIADDGAVTIPALELAGAAARLDLEGGVSAEGIADVTIKGENIRNSEQGTVVESAAIERFALDGHVSGPLDAPSIEARMSLEKARLPSISIGSLGAELATVPAGGDADGKSRSDLRADARITGLALADPSLSRAIGKEATLALRGKGALGGPLDIERFEIETPTLKAELAGRASPDEARVRLDIKAPDLARFGLLAGKDLRGSARLGADIEAAPETGTIAAKIDGETREFGSGIAPIDGLLGGALRLSGGMRRDRDGGFAFDDLRLTGEHASARLDGRASAEAADVSVEAAIPSLTRADKRLAGRGELAAHITGTLARPVLAANISMRDGSMLGRAVPRLVLEADATGPLDAIDARLRLAGEINGKPAQGRATIAWPSGGTTRADDLDLAIGSVAVKGAVTLDPDLLASGSFTVRAGTLDDLSPLVLHKLSGAFDGAVTLARSNGRQDVAVEARGRKIEGLGLGVEKLDADLRVSDLYRRPVLSGSISVADAKMGGQVLSRLRLEAKAEAEVSDVTLLASARGRELDAKARVTAADPVRIDLSRVDIRGGRTRVGLVGPAAITLSQGRAEFRDLAFALNGGRLSIAGRAGTDLDLRIDARAFPLSVADLLAPGLGLGGALDGEATVSGTATAPMGPYRFRVANLVVPQTTSAGLPPLEVVTTGRLDGSRTELETTVSAGPAGSLRLAGNAPLDAAGTFDMAVKGNLDAGIANRSIGVAGRRVAGAIAVDGRVTGTLAAPQATGSLTLSNGSFQDASLGTRLTAIDARVTARGDKLVLDRASATARNGGAITATGEVRLDPAGGFPGSLDVRGRNAEVVRNALATAIVGLDLGVTGPLARSPRLAGRIGIDSLDISIPDQLAGPGQPLDGTRHHHPTPTAARRLAIAEAGRKTAGAAPFDAALDLAIDVPGHIRIAGRGLDAELGGSVKLLGTLADPKPEGAFHLIRGRLRILTSQLDIMRANLDFAGNLSPQLDFLATTQSGGASIKVAVTGDPSDPQFTFTSSPDLPQDEILSRILFGQGSGRLTPTQALALSQAVAIYSGGTSALEGLRRSLGLGAGTRSNSPLANWLGDRVSLGVRTGATPAQTGVGMDISIWRQLKARGTIDAKGGASAGVGTEFEW